MAGLSFIKGSDIIGNLGSTLVSEILGGVNGVMFREAPTASRNMGVGSENYTFHNASAPRPTFLYMVKFISPFNSSTTRTGFDPSSEMSASSGFNFQAKSVDRPSTTIQSEVLNQYNRKRVVYTGRSHTPVSMVFHDDIAGKLQNFWKSYFSHYFQDGLLESSDSLFWDIMQNTINEANTDGYGLRTIPGTTDKYYFDKIIIYQFFGGYYTTITLFNPVISNFNYTSQLTYDNSSGAMADVTITFEYENVAYDLNPQRITKSNAAEFGFYNDYNDPPLGISIDSVSSYLDSFLTRQGIDGTVSSNIGSSLNLSNTTTGRIADNILKSVITATVPNNTSRGIKHDILNVGINAFSNLINKSVSFNSNKTQSTTGAFPVDSNISASNSLFPPVMGGLASVLMKTGLYSEVSSKSSTINSSNFKNSSLLVSNDKGEIQFTEKGLAGVNALVSSSTVFGVSSKSVSDQSSKIQNSLQPKSLKSLYG